MDRLLNVFQDTAKHKQIYIELPHICALVYAISDKVGSYVGNFHNIPANKPFHTDKYLAANALAGPSSSICCKVAK